MTTLRDSLHNNIFNSGRPVKQIADELGISYSYLASAGNPNLEEFHFQLRHLIPLTNATRNFETLDFIEKVLGRVAFTVPNMETTSQVVEETARIVREAGHLLTELSHALEDGRVQSHEWPGIARECDHVIAAVCGLREAAKREAAEL